ncbi:MULTISPECIES: DUF1249 domain-containing protein [Larsenimonas]|uniref:DUF1249 domain-containing protein n=1 Tax=Larsenimonas suaedae TaxID=1851019 RepID=A0ABU1GYB3_9GAMM|nr:MULTISPECIES: DUF1249 domain-containing protein [Larsenimonas]MCM2972889.1 DUF1249 domain-containing protein [Larsenimonas suaedae]MCM5704837.1 DUF1249 domain-containing protein [Larsenimonas salina]MDR5896988.1 DUF1249 domain-containing protein [Larsenimonas suaedae]
MTRTAYVTDLRSLQGECSANYIRLLKLISDAEAGDVRDIALSGQSQRFGTLRIEVLEQAPYTTMLRVHQSGVLDHMIDTPRMMVHLYHDVRMAEVTDFQRLRHFEGRYRYPNAQMHQPDEKLQLNRFLGEWLDHAMAHGHTADLPG